MLVIIIEILCTYLVSIFTTIRTPICRRHQSYACIGWFAWVGDRGFLSENSRCVACHVERKPRSSSSPGMAGSRRWWISHHSLSSCSTGLTFIKAPPGHFFAHLQHPLWSHFKALWSHKTHFFQLFMRNYLFAAILLMRFGLVQARLHRTRTSLHPSIALHTFLIDLGTDILWFCSWLPV